MKQNNELNQLTPQSKRAGLPAALRPWLAAGLLMMAAFIPPLAAQPALPGFAVCQEVMLRANNYWISNNVLGNSGWANSAHYTGNQRAFRWLNESAYLDRGLDWAAANQWKVGPEAGKNNDADSQCCGQTYLDLYLLDRQPERIADIKQKIDAFLATTNSIDDWWWIDAFHMAAPTLARLGRITGDTNYFQQLILMYDDMKTRLGLYDAASGLWFRDGSYLYPAKQTSGGNKVFWARGNGWVIGGLARVIEQMPTNAPQRAEMVSMFQTMAAALKNLQPLHGTDGMWRSSLHEPTQFPGPETSGTAFFTYALAWGVRTGLLDAGQYTNTIALAWQGLTNLALAPSGRLGYVQAVGKEPGTAAATNTAAYAVGAFLLAASEIGLLDPNSPAVSPWAGPDEVVPDSGFDSQELVHLDATATEVYRGTVNAYVWLTNNVAVATGATAQVMFPLGTNVVTLQVQHSSGQTYTRPVVKTVLSTPALVADAGADEFIPDLGNDGSELVTLDASGTQVHFGSVVSFHWWRNNSLIASGTNVQVSLPLGQHVITLKALSSEGPEYSDTVVKSVFVSLPAVGAGDLLSHTNDAAATYDGGDPPPAPAAPYQTLRATDATINVGRQGGSGRYHQAAIFPFQLPSLGSGEIFVSANFQFNMTDETVAAGVNTDLYGLPARNTSEVLPGFVMTSSPGDFYMGGLLGAPADDPTVGVVKLQNNILVNGAAAGLKTTDAAGSSNLVAYLNAQYAGGAGAGKWVFLRLNVDTLPGTQRYTITMSEGGTAGPPDTRPLIHYTLSGNPQVAMSPAGNGGFFLNWVPSNWVLEQTTNLASGPWFPVPGATVPQLITPSGPQQFFRIRQP